MGRSLCISVVVVVSAFGNIQELNKTVHSMNI